MIKRVINKIIDRFFDCRRKYLHYWRILCRLSKEIFKIRKNKISFDVNQQQLNCKINRDLKFARKRANK